MVERNCSGKYLYLRRMEQVNSAGYSIKRNYVIYTGHVVLLGEDFIVIVYF
jgi:hypothetical protein